MIDKLYITQIDEDYDCDTFLPNIPGRFKLESIEVAYENNTKLEFKIFS